MGVGRGRESSRGGGREAVGCLEEGEMEREREEGKGEKELEVDRWKERGSKVASVYLLRTIFRNCNGRT